VEYRPGNRTLMIDLMIRSWEECDHRHMPEDSAYRDLLPHIADYLLIGCNDPTFEVEDLRQHIGGLDVIGTVMFEIASRLRAEIPAAAARVDAPEEE
jgi:hypothetical protein